MVGREDGDGVGAACGRAVARGRRIAARIVLSSILGRGCGLNGGVWFFFVVVLMFERLIDRGC